MKLQRKAVNFGFPTYVLHCTKKRPLISQQLQNSLSLQLCNKIEVLGIRNAKPELAVG